MQQRVNALGGMAFVQQFANHQGLQVMSEVIASFTALFLRRRQAAERLIMPQGSDGKGTADPLVAAFMCCWHKARHHVIHHAHKVIHAEMMSAVFNSFQFMNCRGRNADSCRFWHIARCSVCCNLAIYSCNIYPQHPCISHVQSDFIRTDHRRHACACWSDDF